MRRSLAVFWLIALVSDVAAQEFELPTLRGSSSYVPAPPVYHRWSGFYGGGQLGFTSSNIMFGNSVSTVLADAIRLTKVQSEVHPEAWPSIPSVHPKGANFGGFVGYNSQWDDVVLGVEVNYTHSTLKGTGSDTIRRLVTLSDDFSYDVTVTAAQTVELHDLVTGRVRAAYTMGQFLPYFFAGFAVGGLDYSKTGSVGYPTPTYALPPPIPPTQPPPTPPSLSPPATKTEVVKNAVALGYAVGAGVDVEVLPHVFLRGEYEYIAMPLARMNLQLHNFRLGAGLKL